jgi:multicomponent Na+:H+ antiporter subunit E
MTQARHPGVQFAALLFFWLVLNGSLASDVLIIGVIAAAVITLLLPGAIPFFGQFRAGEPRAWAAAVGYFTYFFKELVKSNLRIAAVVLAPSLPVSPGIVKVRTKLKTPMGRLLLANSITLTPGTLTVDLDGDWLYIHWVRVESVDVDKATAEIVAGFERYLEVMYG